MRTAHCVGLKAYALVEVERSPLCVYCAALLCRSGRQELTLAKLSALNTTVCGQKMTCFDYADCQLFRDPRERLGQSQIRFWSPKC